MPQTEQIRNRMTQLLKLTIAATLLTCGMTNSVVAQDETGAADTEASQDDPQSLADKASYAIGFNIGSDISNEELGLNIEVVIQGILDAAAGKENKLSNEELQAVMTAFEKEVFARQQAKFEEMAQKNLEAGEAFMAENATKEGVKQLESGIQYRVINAGEGDSPTAESVVKAHYRGTLPNGEEFDSSYSRDEPFTFNVGGVIRGWGEVIPRMKVGDKWEVVIPAALAYGPNGSPPSIGPNQVLVFEIELIEIVQ